MTQDLRRRVNDLLCRAEATGSTIAGYYTLAVAGVLLADVPKPLAKRLPRYPSVPVARLGR